MQRIELEDFLRFSAVSAPTCAPRGDGYTWVRHQPDLEHNTYTHALFLSVGGEVRHLSDAVPAEPLWLDEENLIYETLHSSGRGSRFVQYHIPTGTSSELFELPFHGQLVAKMLDGRYLVKATVHVMEQRRVAGKTGDALARAWDEIDRENDMCWVIDEFPYWQNGQGLTNKLRTGLYIVKENGLTERITGELFDVENACYVPQRHAIYFNGAAHDHRKAYWTGIYVYDLSSGSTKCLVEPGHFEIGYFGLAGDQIILTACRQDEGKTLAQMHDLYRLSLEDGTLTMLHSGELSYGNAIGTDITYGGGCQFVAREDAAYFLVCIEERTELMRFVYGGTLETVCKIEGAITSFAMGGDRILFAAVKDMKPSELYSLEDGAVTKLTAYNDSYCESHSIVRPEEIRFVNNEGNEIHGQVLLPPDFNRDRSYPAILDIHGGPRAAYGTVFYHEMQYWANCGYVVMYCNPTGSLGRGQYFGDVCGKTGLVDYDDIMQFVDVVLAAYPQIDEKRVGVTGGSYGGFMTNWIIGHTDRFAAAVSQRSTSNNLSNEATTGNGELFTRSCLKAGEVRSDELLWEQSPLKYAENAVTPTLFIAALEDYCCYHVEALQMYTALNRMGVDTRVCLFRHENHSLSRTGRPEARIRRLQEITGWMDHYLRK